MFSINTIPWLIKLVSPYDPMLQRSDGSYTIGMCDNDLKTIFIDETLRGRILRKVLCHELTHAAMFSYGINLGIQQEEVLADLIATYGTEIISITDKIFKKLQNGR